MNQNNTLNLTSAPSLLKLGACFIYDALIVIALSFAVAGLFLLLFGDATHGIKRYLLQFMLWFFIGCYFVWCWTKSGQTLAMKTWKLKIVDHNGNLPSIKLASLRYILATLSLALFGIGFIWVIVNRDKSYIHDQWLKTRIIAVPRDIAS